MFPISLKRMHFSLKISQLTKQQLIPQKRKKKEKKKLDSDLRKIISFKILMYVSINYLHIAEKVLLDHN